MSLLSRFKQKQETTSDQDNGDYRSRAEDDTKPARSSKRAENGRKSKVADPVLPEKKRARRRLIGAVALVLAAVIGLPMILDSEPKPLADDIAIQIPSKDKLPSVEPVATPKALSKRPEANEEIIDLPQTTQKSTTLPASKETGTLSAATSDSKATVKNETKLESKVQSEAKGDAKTAMKVESKPDNKQDAKTVKTETKPDAKSEVKAVSPSTPSGTKPAAKLSAQDDDAARALAILEGKPVKPPVKSEAAPKDRSGYVVQAGAFSTQEKVTEVQDKLKAAGIKSYTQKVATSPAGDKSVTRIRVGPFESKDEADKAAANLVKLGLSPKLIPN